MKPSPFWSYLLNCAETFEFAAASAFEIFPSLLVSSDSNEAPPCCEGCVDCEGGEDCGVCSGVAVLCANAPAIGSSSAAGTSSLDDFMMCPLVSEWARKRGKHRASRRAFLRGRRAPAWRKAASALKL